MFLTSILQTLCLIAAGYGLWRLWGVIARRGKLIALIVAAGFVGRSLAGQLLFWISYLQLPYGRSLQLGNGLWFFGLDALHYYGAARTAALRSLHAVLFINPNEPSFIYIKLVAIFLWLFGTPTSTAILLNLAAYLATVVLIILCGERRGVDRRIIAITVAAISILPSALLWSLQPLKDAFVLFLAVLFAFSVNEFVAAWRAERGRARVMRVLFWAAMMIATTYCLAGIRWYYALILLLAASIPLLAIIVAARGAGAVVMRAAVMVVLMIVLTQNVVAAAGVFLPRGMRAVLRPWSTRAGVAQRLGHVEHAVDQSRQNLDSYTTASTRIRAGSAVAKKEDEQESAATPSPEPRAVTATTPQSQPEPQETPGQAAAPVTEPSAAATHAPAVTQTNAPAPELPPVNTTTVAETPPPPVQATTAEAQPAAAPPPAAAPATEPARAPAPAQTAVPVQKTPAPAKRNAPAKKAALPKSSAPVPVPTTAPVQTPTPAPAPAVVADAPAQTPAPPPKEADVPTTRSGRLITGLAALLLPRPVGAALGLVSIQGGRGLMWFVDFDTILFNVVMIACAVIFFTGLRRGAWRDPFLWYLVVATIVISAGLAYTVSNYGTLFRHRQMVLAPMALIAIAAARPRPEAERAPEAA